MIRAISPALRFALVCVFAVGGLPAASLAQQSAARGKAKPHSASATPASSKPAPAKTAGSKTAGSKDAAGADSAAGKPSLVASFGDWGAYAAKTGAAKTCYALARPTDRQPSDLKRDQAYIFIAERPAENVRDEISIIMGFDVKGGVGQKVAGGNAGSDPAVASAEVGTQKFPMVAKGSNLWVENIAMEGPMIAAMRKSGKLVIRAPSLKGRMATDDYSLKGLAPALDRVHKECQ